MTLALFRSMPCRSARRELGRDRFGLLLARQERGEGGLYHLYDSSGRVCGGWGLSCDVPRPGSLLAAFVPDRGQRCRSCWGWPPYAPRPWEGPLPQQWAGSKIPRWYVWWRLFGLQQGRCASCAAPAQAIDHDHDTGAVRGLLCLSCNRVETMYARRQRVCVHKEPCFVDYWKNPPAAELGWLRLRAEQFRHAA